MTLAERMKKECKKITIDCERCKYRDICFGLDWRVSPEEWNDKTANRYDLMFKKIVEEWSK